MFSYTLLTPATCDRVLLLPLDRHPSRSVFVSAILISTAFREEMCVSWRKEEEKVEEEEEEGGGGGGGRGGGIRHLTKGKGTKCYPFRELGHPYPCTCSPATVSSLST